MPSAVNISPQIFDDLRKCASLSRSIYESLNRLWERREGTISTHALSPELELATRQCLAFLTEAERHAAEIRERFQKETRWVCPD